MNRKQTIVSIIVETLVIVVLFAIPAMAGEEHENLFKLPKVGSQQLKLDGDFIWHDLNQFDDPWYTRLSLEPWGIHISIGEDATRKDYEYGIGWHGKLWNKLILDTSYITREADRDNTIKVFTGVPNAWLGLMPYIFAEQSLQKNGNTLDGSFFYRLGVRRSFVLPSFLAEQKILFDYSLVTFDPAGTRFDEIGDSGRWNVSTRFPIGQHVTLIPNIRIHDPYNPNTTTEAWGWLKMEVRF